MRRWIIAGLIACGQTEVEEIRHIERGYECVVEKSRGLGARMEKMEVPDADVQRAIGYWKRFRFGLWPEPIF
ncbi:MAG: hypothetical protein ACLRXC_07930 [[Clostridium] leptum]